MLIQKIPTVELINDVNNTLYTCIRSSLNFFVFSVFGFIGLFCKTYIGYNGMNLRKWFISNPWTNKIHGLDLVIAFVNSGQCDLRNVTRFWKRRACIRDVTMITCLLFTLVTSANQPCLILTEFLQYFISFIQYSITGADPGFIFGGMGRGGGGRKRLCASTHITIAKPEGP